MGKQQSILDQLKSRKAELEGTAPIVDEPTPVLNETEQLNKDEARQAELDKIDNMSNAELSAYIDSLPGGKTKSDKPLPDMASSGRPVQAFEKGALALSDVKLSDDKVKAIKEEGMIALGDNGLIVQRFENVLGGMTLEDFASKENPAESFKKYKTNLKNNAEYVKSFLNPGAFKNMSEYAGNEELKADFTKAINLTQQFSDNLKTADALKNELAPYLNGKKQAQSQEELNNLNAKLKQLNQLQISLASKLDNKTNEKGESVPSDMMQSISAVKESNTWTYGNVDDDRYGFDESGGIITGKEWKRNSEGIVVSNDIKTDAGAMEEAAAYKSIMNIDDEFNSIYQQRVSPIYESYLTNAVKKLDSKNPDDQRNSFDVLMSALQDTEVLPLPKRTIDRIRQAGSYDDQITALKSFYNMPIGQDGTLLQAMVKRTNPLRKSQFVLNQSQTDFGQDAGNYPTTFDETFKSQKAWFNFAANGDLKQVQQDKKEWDNSATEIKGLMESYIDSDMDLTTIMENAIDESKIDSSFGAYKDSRRIETSLDTPGGKDLLLDASRQIIGKNNRVLSFDNWMRTLVNQDNPDKLGGDKFSRLFGATAFDWATNNGTFTIYVNDEGKTIRANPFDNDEPMTTPPEGYKPLTLNTVTLASNGKPDVNIGSGRRRGINPEYYMATNNATAAIERAKKFYDQMSERIQEEYSDLNTAYRNKTTTKLSGLGNNANRGLMQYGLDLRMGGGNNIANTKAYRKESSSIDFDEGNLGEFGYKNPKLKVTNKLKNIQDGIFSLIAPNGEFMDYNDSNYVDPITKASGSFENHTGQGANKMITVSNSWDNNAMPEGEKWTFQNSANNKNLLEEFFNQGEKESDKDYEKRMGDVKMTAWRVGMEKDKSTYQFLDGNGKSVFVNIPHKSLEATGENFFKYTGKTAGEKEFEITGQELLSMPKLQNGDNAFNEPLYLKVDGKDNYVIPIAYEDANGVEVKLDFPTNLPRSITSLPVARTLANQMISNIVKQRIQPINQ